MRFKASTRDTNDSSLNPAETGGSGRGRHEDSGPIPPPELEIARLARGLANTGGDEGRADDPDQNLERLTVGLYRRELFIGDSGSYFALKMLLVRNLRRSFRDAVIEVDDADGVPDGDALYTIDLEPDDPKAVGRAGKVVRRVLRSRHWRRGWD